MRIALLILIVGSTSPWTLRAQDQSSSTRNYSLQARQAVPDNLPVNKPTVFSRHTQVAPGKPPSDMRWRFTDTEGASQITTLSSEQREEDSALLSTSDMLAPLDNATELFQRAAQQSTFLDTLKTAQSLSRAAASGYDWNPSRLNWLSPTFAHRPLYFEQPNFERFGIGCAPVLRPAVSAAHFFGIIPLMPYKAFTQHPLERVFTLGHARPGNCVPLTRNTLLGNSTCGEYLLYYQDGSGYQ